MDKRFGFHPSIILSTSGGDAGVIGHGSGHGSSNPVPVSYDTWTKSVWNAGYDFDEDGEFSFEEYCDWWADRMAENGDVFTMDLWAELNPGREWEGE